MTAYLAGVTHRRCTGHPRAGEITGAMRGVLAVMSFPARDARSDCPDDERYVCTLSWSSIARESGYARDYLRHVLIVDMVGLGLVERVGEARPRQPTHWRLKIHADAERERLGSSRPQDPEQGWGPQSPRLGLSKPQAGAVRAPNPSDSSRPPGREGGGRSGAAFGAPSLPGGRDDAAAPSTVDGGRRTGVLAEIADTLGCTSEQASAWAERKLAVASSPVRNETAFLRRCLAVELEQQAAPPRTSAKGTSAARGPAKVRGSAGSTSAAKCSAKGGKRTAPARHVSSPESRLAAVRRVLSGEATAEQVAAELGKAAGTVQGWAREARSSAVHRVIYGGQSLDEAAALHNVPMDVLRPLVDEKQAERRAADERRKRREIEKAEAEARAAEKREAEFAAAEAARKTAAERKAEDARRTALWTAQAPARPPAGSVDWARLGEPRPVGAPW